MKQIWLFEKGGLSHRAKLKGKKAREHFKSKPNLLMQKEVGKLQLIIPNYRTNSRWHVSSPSHELSRCSPHFTSQQPESTATGYCPFPDTAAGGTDRLSVVKSPVASRVMDV